MKYIIPNNIYSQQFTNQQLIQYLFFKYKMLYKCIERLSKINELIISFSEIESYNYIKEILVPIDEDEFNKIEQIFNKENNPLNFQVQSNVPELNVSRKPEILKEREFTYLPTQFPDLFSDPYKNKYIKYKKKYINLKQLKN